MEDYKKCEFCQGTGLAEYFDLKCTPNLGEGVHKLGDICNKLDNCPNGCLGVLEEFNDKEFIKVTKNVINSLEPKVYEIKTHLGDTIIADLRNYWDEDGNLNEIYYINYIESHGEYIREVSL